MGFMSSIGKMFSGAPKEARRNASGVYHSGSDAAGTAVAEAPVDQATMLRERLAQDRATQPISAPKEARAEASDVTEHGLIERTGKVEAPTPRNKQELFEELQKNYREVVDLVRKVDNHLDRNDKRASEMLDIARRVDQALPALAEFPSEMRTHLAELREGVTAAIHEHGTRSDERAARINGVLESVEKKIAASGASQAQLVTTMAGFRETLGDLADSSSRTSTVLEDIDHRRMEREDELTKMLVASRRWSVAAMALAIVIGSVALAVGVVALVVN